MKPVRRFALLQQTLTSVRLTTDTVNRSALIRQARSRATAMIAISWRTTENIAATVRCQVVHDGVILVALHGSSNSK